MSFGQNIYICECGGLRHKCARFGHLPESIGHYTTKRAAPVEYDVVWSGSTERQGAATVQLLADRAERPDARLSVMPTYDLDDGEAVDERPSRKYTLTGKHVGKFSRTDPTAPQYIPTKKDAEEQTHG